MASLNEKLDGQNLDATIEVVVEGRDKVEVMVEGHYTMEELEALFSPPPCPQISDLGVGDDGKKNALLRIGVMGSPSCPSLPQKSPSKPVRKKNKEFAVHRTRKKKWIMETTSTSLDDLDQLLPLVYVPDNI